MVQIRAGANPFTCNVADSRAAAILEFSSVRPGMDGAMPGRFGSGRCGWRSALLSLSRQRPLAFCAWKAAHLRL